ncbi:MAG: hypothetical protein HZC45_00560 [Deltaproteobacteria bacterium]|nr:hypothetical protein [Deltaproteobacteria bacterium]
MNKVLLFLFAVVIWAAWVSYSYAAQAKVSGYYEIKGFAYDNVDLNNAVDDGVSNTGHEFRLNIDVEEGPPEFQCMEP